MTNRAVFLSVVALVYSYVLYDIGRSHGLAEPKKCASVEGQQVVSTTAEVCTYAAVYGRSVTKRRAM